MGESNIFQAIFTELSKNTGNGRLTTVTEKNSVGFVSFLSLALMNYDLSWNIKAFSSGIEV